MRSILVLLVLLAGMIAGGWIGGETLLARSATKAIAADPRISAGRVEELREAQRIGVRIEAPRFADPAAGAEAAADWLDLWLRPEGLNALEAALAPGADATLAGRRLALGPEGAEAGLRFSPTHGLDLSQADFTAGALTLDGAPALKSLALKADLTGFGADAPKGTGATYAVSGSASGVGLGALSAGAAEGMLAAEGGGRVWLSAVPLSAGALLTGVRRTEPRPPAQLVGFRLDGVRVTLDDLSARIFGRLTADANGFAEGEILIDSADTAAFVQRAADAGLIPAKDVVLARTLLKAVSVPTAAPDSKPDAPASSAADEMRDELLHPGTRWPDPQQGESRLPLTFRGGRMMLGPLPVGEAPRFAPAG